MNAGKNPANRRGHLRVAPLSLAPGNQPDEQMRVIRRSMRECLHKGNFRECRHTLGDGLSGLRRFRQRGALGKREGTDQFRLVIGGDPVASYEVIKTKRGKKSSHANQNDGAPVRKGPVQHPQIQKLHGVQEALGVCFLFASPQLQKTRAHHWRKSKSYQQGNENGHRHGPSERIDIFPRITGHERDRQENNHERESGGHHR